MSQCPHRSFGVITQVSRVVTEQDYDKLGEEAPVDMFVADIQFHCKECKQLFSFNWTESASPDELPLSQSMMKRRPWLTIFGDTLGITLSPIEGRYYGEIETATQTRQ